MGRVAQLAECLTTNQEVRGSNPRVTYLFLFSFFALMIFGTVPKEVGLSVNIPVHCQDAYNWYQYVRILLAKPCPLLGIYYISAAVVATT